MRILFCSEGFIIDGVASYNLYLSAALVRAGHEVAVVGRWAGLKGYQQLHRRHGVQVLQRPALSRKAGSLVALAAEFKPELIITDARRSFPFALRVRRRTGAPVITVFHDPPLLDRTGERSIASLAAESIAWVTSERPIYEALQAIGAEIPLRHVPRPVDAMMQVFPMPQRDPFRLLCMGRLSGWKSWGSRAIVAHAAELRREIPSLEITVLGGGGRYLSFWRDARAANRAVGTRFVRLAGMQIDPQPFLREASVVCAGATSAVEAILCGRPVLAVSGWWIGPITEENLQIGVDCHFGDRVSVYKVRNDADAVCQGVIDFYRGWQDAELSKRVEDLRVQLAKAYSAEETIADYHALFQETLLKAV